MSEESLPEHQSKYAGGVATQYPALNDRLR
jgi:hypothetical protein